MSQNPPFSPSPSPNPGPNNGIRMSNEELLSRRSDWTLACDNALLNKLRDFSENMVSSARELSVSCNSLSDDVSSLQFSISNITNEFLMLADTRFVENRVQEFEECSVVGKHPPKQVVMPSKAEKEAALIEKMKESIQFGVRVQQERDKLRPVTLEDSLATSTDSRLTASVNVAHLIGSSKFFSSKYCGLLNENNRLGYESSNIANSAASSSNSSSSLIGATEVNNASEKLIFPNFEPSNDDNLFSQVTPGSQQIPTGSGSGSSINFVPPKPPPFPAEFYSGVPPRPPVPAPPSPTSSTSSSFFESGVPSQVANIFSNQGQNQHQPTGASGNRPIATTPPDPDLCPRPILDVSDSDDDDIFNSNQSTITNNPPGIHSYFANQPVPSYAYVPNLFNQPPPVPVPVPTSTVSDTSDLNTTNVNTKTDLTSKPAPMGSKEANFREVIKSLANSSEAFKSKSRVSQDNAHVPKTSEKVSEQKTEPVKPQKPSPAPVKLPPPPKRTTIFDDSDSDDDLFSTMSTKSQKIIPSSFKEPPTLPFESQQQANSNYNSINDKTSRSGLNFNNTDLRPPPVLDVSENESDDDSDDIFKSLGYSSKVGQRKNNINDSFLSRISPPLPVHETLRDSARDRDRVSASFESPSTASVPVQDENLFQKEITNNDEPELLETGTSKSQSDSHSYSNASIESDIIPINVNESPSPPTSRHSEAHNQTLISSRRKSSQSKTEHVISHIVEAGISSHIPNANISAPSNDNDFFDAEPESEPSNFKIRPAQPITDLDDRAGEPKLNTLNAEVSESPKVVTVPNPNINTQSSYSSVWVPPVLVPPRPPSPSISTDDEDDFDIFKSQKSSVKPVVEAKIASPARVPTAIPEPQPPPVPVPDIIEESEPPELPVPSRLPAFASASVAKPKFQSQNIGRLKSKSIFDSSDSDDDLFSSKPKSIKSTPSVKDASPQPKLSIFSDEPDRYFEPPSLKSVAEPPPFVNKSHSHVKSNNLLKDNVEAILNRPPRILDLSDDDSDDDLFKSMTKSQTSGQQPEIKIIGDTPKPSFSSSSSTPTPFPVQASMPVTQSKSFFDPSISEEEEHNIAPGSTIRPSVEVPPPLSTSTSSLPTVLQKQNHDSSVSTSKVNSDFTQPKSNSKLKTIKKEKSIFESSESDDDLFSSKITITPKSLKSVAMPPPKSPIFARSAASGNNAVGKNSSKKSTLSLFEDSDDDSSDLFKGTSSNKIKDVGAAAPSIPRQGSLTSVSVSEQDSSDKIVGKGSIEGISAPVATGSTKSTKDEGTPNTNFEQAKSKTKSSRSSSVTEARGEEEQRPNPRDKIFGAVAKSLDNIFSAKNNLRIGSSAATLSSNFCDSASFDQEASTENILRCITKDRPKISHPRRPPSLKRRQYSKSTSSLHMSNPNPDTNELDPLV